MQLLIILLMAVVVVWLLRILVKTGKQRSQSSVSGRNRGASRVVNRPGKPCPLCNTPLEAGERVHSVVFPGKTDKLVEIYGCPHCRPTSGSATSVRICPVCKHALDEKGYVVARMFENGARKHVHVLGCTRCRPGS